MIMARMAFIFATVIATWKCVEFSEATNDLDYQESRQKFQIATLDLKRLQLC